MPLKSFRPNRFVPTAPRTGDNSPFTFRGKNLWIRGTDEFYAECYQGSENLSETIPTSPLTGYASFTANSKTISGVGTLFLSELHIGQFYFLGGELLVVDSILSDILHTVTRAPSTSYAAKTFVDANVNTSTEIITITAHALLTGDQVRLRSAGTLPAGLALATNYWVIKVDANTFKLASTLANALAGTAVNITAAAGGGTHTIHQTPLLFPVIFEMDKKRGTLIRGNALEFEQGSIIAVGDGTLRINGAVLPGTSLVAAKSPKIAVFNTTTGNYAVFTLGSISPPPTGITATNVVGGTKGMTAGVRGLRFCKARVITGKGYGNPSDNIPVTLIAGDKIEITFPAMDTANGQDAWIIFGTIYQSATSVNAAEGPWYYIAFLTTADVADSGGTYNLEYLNSEITKSELLSFNNEAPPDAEFVQSLTGYPIYVSCQGKGNASKPDGTSPGPFIVPAKPNNIEAAPLGYPNPVATSPPETILGAFSTGGRLYLMTPNRLVYVSFTGNPTFPVTVRPYYKRGFMNPYNAAVVDDYIFSSTTKGFTRSAAEGDGSLEKYDLTSDVKELAAIWNLGHQLVGHDPKNEAVCFFYSGAYKNTAGYWVTLVFPYMLEKQFFNTPIVIESQTRDMIVSGVATVNGYLEFLAGGRMAAGGVQVDTFRFDTGSGQSIDWYLAWSFRDDGAEQMTKVIKGYRLTGKTTAAVLDIYGSRSNALIDVAALEAGTGSASGAKSIADTSAVTIGEFDKDMIVRELLLYTARVGGTWDGNGIPDRIDELVVNVEPGGLRK